MNKKCSKKFSNEKNNPKKTSSFGCFETKKNSKASESRTSLEVNKIAISHKEVVSKNEFKSFIQKRLRENERSEENIDDNVMASNINAKEFVQNQYKMKKEDLKKVEEEKVEEKEEEEEEKEKEEEEEEEQKEEEEEMEEEEAKEKIYSYEFLMQFETLEISTETNLLNEEVLNHINAFKVVYKEEKGPKIQPWAKKDFTKEEKIAEENKKKFNESDKKDKGLKELREIMNIMTKDTFDENKLQILEILKDNKKLQEEFITRILFKKAVMERPYAELYCNLCKFLNKKLPQKSEKSEKSSFFREIFVDECRELLKATNFDKYVNAQDQQEREVIIKKLNLGNINLLLQFIKMKLLPKKIIQECFDYIFKKYKNEESIFLKSVFAESIIFLIDKFGEFINEEKKNLKEEDVKTYEEKIDFFFGQLKEIENDKSVPAYIRFKIVNLIEKKKNNYKLSEFEKSLRALSKKEVEEEMLNKDNGKDIAEDDEETKEREQEEIKEKIKKDLSDYRDFVEEEGSSDKFSWKTTTLLYDVQFKSIDDIIEGYINASADFIEKENNIKYAKDYVRELIGFYNEKMDESERDDLQKRAFALFDQVSDYAYETPNIYDVYAHMIFVFMQNEIMEINDLQKILKEKEDLEKFNKVLKNLYEYDKSEEFKNELKAIPLIKKNKGLFKWVF